MNIDEILKESSDSIEIDDLESVKMYENIKSKCLKQKTQRKDKTHLYTLLAIICTVIIVLVPLSITSFGNFKITSGFDKYIQGPSLIWNEWRTSLSSNSGLRKQKTIDVYCSNNLRITESALNDYIKIDKDQKAELTLYRNVYKNEYDYLHLINNTSVALYKKEDKISYFFKEETFNNYYFKDNIIKNDLQTIDGKHGVIAYTFILKTLDDEPFKIYVNDELLEYYSSGIIKSYFNACFYYNTYGNYIKLKTPQKLKNVVY